MHTQKGLWCLQTDAAVFRTQETLENGCKEIDECVASFEDVGIQDRSMVWNTDLVETLELENLLTNAAVTMHSAEARKVSPASTRTLLIMYIVHHKVPCALKSMARQAGGLIWIMRTAKSTLIICISVHT